MISIHALLAESDSILDYFSAVMRQFLSTLSLRRATRIRQRNKFRQCHFYPRSPCGERHQDKFSTPPDKKISIHALLAESDRCQASDISVIRISIHALLAESDDIRSIRQGTASNFYPRSPCGERLSTLIIGFLARVFLSTLSLRRATILPPVDTSSVRISIHALLAESDPDGLFFFIRRSNFYPRSPCGERHRQTS